MNLLEELRIFETTEATSYIDWATIQSEDDYGWMYKTLQAGTIDMHTRLGEGVAWHLIWPADSF